MACRGESQVARGAKTGNKILGLFGVPGAENEICLDGELNHRTVLVWLRFSRGNNAKNLTFSSSFFFSFHSSSLDSF